MRKFGYQFMTCIFRFMQLKHFNKRNMLRMGTVLRNVNFVCDIVYNNYLILLNFSETGEYTANQS